MFWTRNFAALGVRGVAGLVAAAILYLNIALVSRRLGPVRLRRTYGNLEIAEQVPRHYVTIGTLLIAALGGWWIAMLQFGGGIPLQVWAWFHHASWGTTDPLFHRDLSFYVFTLPVVVLVLDHLLVTVFWALVLVTIGYSLIGGVTVQQNKARFDPFARSHFSGIAAAFLCLLALRFVVGRYGFAIDGNGVHGGVGYTDVHARILAQWVLAWLAVIAAIAILYGDRRSLIVPPLAALALFVVGGTIFVSAYPAIIQKVKVQPNQLARETPYLEWNLDFTRQAYGLSSIERRELPYATAGAPAWASATRELHGLALWDVDQLIDAYNQVQTFQGYYTFTDVDFDRYVIGGGVQQLGIAVREFTQEGLPNDSRNWFNLHRRPEFTRGVGAVAARTNTTVGGAPSYLVGEISPIQVDPQAPSLAFTDPSVYFGELTNEYIVLGADSGKAAPKTGIAIGSILRRIAFAWRFGDHNLLFTSDLDAQSRLLYRRLVRERVRAVAPFLRWDRDALPVVVDGRIQWVLDGYTVSASFPFSSTRDVPDIGNDLKYMRGSVKAAVDAATGAITLYAVDRGDPILRTFGGMFPGLIHDQSAMPEWMRAHLRYPSTLLELQADILEQYHVTQANSFYAGQEAWDVPVPGSTRGTPRHDEPLYLELQMPGDSAPHFVTLLPFTALRRQNLTAVLYADNDPPNYGELSLLQVENDAQIKGPAQIQSLIEQDPEISQQLSLWRQLGTAVEMGQLRIIPTTASVLYVEPLFLAAEDKAIPQLHRVIVSDGSNVAMAETLDRSIALLLAKSGVTAGPPSAETTAAASAANVTLPTGDWPKEAMQIYEQAERELRAGDFAAFGASWQRLRTVLQRASAGHTP